MAGLAGPLGSPGIIPPEQSFRSPDSDSISPRVNTKKYRWMRKYETQQGTGVIRFLINTNIQHDQLAEIDVFKRAIAYMQDSSIISAETILQRAPIPPRSIECNNVVLVDMFDKRVGFQRMNPKFYHTICLWKKTDHVLLIIDPSSDTFSKRLLENPLELKNRFPPFVIETKKHIGDTFYKPFSDTTSNANEPNKDARDCIDIAVKIAFSLNLARQAATKSFS